jgi:hypothetical protein
MLQDYQEIDKKLKTTECSNCHSKRRRVYRSGFCSKCYYWYRKRRTLEKEVTTFKDHGATRARGLRFQIQTATRILEEYAGRERPLNDNDVDALQIEALLYTVAAECRSEISFAVHSWLFDLNHSARMCFYCILLEIVEKIPAYRPRLHTLERPVKGSYLRLT